jgi:putative transposase
LAIEVDTSITGERVSRVLDRLLAIRGKPDRLGSDNGPEFRCMKMDQWAYRYGVKLQFIPPGKPTKNAYIESFNATFRDDCLNQHWFRDIKDARETIEAWRKVYNTIKPHGSLARMTPQAFAAAHPLGGEKEFKLTG